MLGLIAFPLVVAILGALVYAFAAAPKVQEMGRILFFVGALGCVILAGPEMVRLSR